MDFERSGSYPYHSTGKSGEDTFKPGRVAGALVQGPKLILASDTTRIDGNRWKSGPP